MNARYLRTQARELLLEGNRRQGRAVPASDLRIRTSTQYDKFAEECAHLATKMEMERERRVLTEMAATWRKLAEEAERRELYRGPC